VLAYEEDIFEERLLETKSPITYEATE